MLSYDTQDRVIGTELVTASASSGGNGNPSDTTGLSTRNPHIKFYSNLRGYLRTTSDTTHLTADFRALDTITTPDAPIRTLRQFTVEPGLPGLQAP